MLAKNIFVAGMSLLDRLFQVTVAVINAAVVFLIQAAPNQPICLKHRRPLLMLAEFRVIKTAAEISLVRFLVRTIFENQKV